MTGHLIRVAIVDDQAMVRAGFRMILDAEADLTVVAEAADGRDAVAMVERAQPDVVLMDVRMPVLDGIEATRAIRASVTRPPAVLMLTTFDLDDHVYAALRAGAAGFLLKDATPEDLIHAIRVVAAGDALLAPSVTRRLIDDIARRPGGATRELADLEQLTDRELEVLRLIARGFSNAEIAAQLYLGEATVKTHVGRILMKLKVRDRVQAVVLAYESGLVTPGEDPVPPAG